MLFGVTILSCVVTHPLVIRCGHFSYFQVVQTCSAESVSFPTFNNTLALILPATPCSPWQLWCFIPRLILLALLSTFLEDPEGDLSGPICATPSNSPADLSCTPSASQAKSMRSALKPMWKHMHFVPRLVRHSPVTSSGWSHLVTSV